MKTLKEIREEIKSNKEEQKKLAKALTQLKAEAQRSKAVSVIVSELRKLADMIENGEVRVKEFSSIPSYDCINTHVTDPMYIEYRIQTSIGA